MVIQIYLRSGCLHQSVNTNPHSSDNILFKTWQEGFILDTLPAILPDYAFRQGDYPSLIVCTGSGPNDREMICFLAVQETALP